MPEVKRIYVYGIRDRSALVLKSLAGKLMRINIRDEKGASLKGWVDHDRKKMYVTWVRK